MELYPESACLGDPLILAGYGNLVRNGNLKENEISFKMELNPESGFLLDPLI